MEYGVSNNTKRKLQNQWKKNQVNRSYQFWEKSQKLLEITQTPKMAFSGSFGDFSRNW